MISFVPRFGAPYGPCLGRRKRWPQRFSLFSAFRGKEGEGRKIPCLYLVRFLEKLQINMPRLGIKCCLNPLEWMALERVEVQGLNLLLLCSSSKLEILQFRETVWMEASFIFPSGSPSSCGLSCQHGGGAISTLAGRSLWQLPESSREGRERPGAAGRDAWPKLQHRCLFSSPRDCKVWANSPKSTIIHFHLPCRVGLRLSVLSC